MFKGSNVMDTETYRRGALPSIIERFEITNLYGYKTISLESPHSATVLIAQNGAGKTTLLNALDAFLKGQFLRLKNLRFSEIRCRLNSADLVITQQDIQSLSNLPPDNEIEKFSLKSQIDPPALISFLFNDFSISREDYFHLHDHPVFEKAIRAFDYNGRATSDYLEKLQTKLFSYNNNLTQVITTIRTVLKDFEILYLPTYRRIESPLVLDKEEDPYRRRKTKFPFRMFSGDIQFGLSDISERLSELNRKILFESNRGYRQLSADIIKELLDGSFDRAEMSDLYLPSSEDLKLFFTRLKEGRRAGPFDRYEEIMIPDIDLLLSEKSSASDTNRFLLYFISKLNLVMEATKGIENQVEDFIAKCNKYLSNSEIEKNNTPAHGVLQNDSKELRLNRANLSVSAVSIPSGRKIALDALSSGEKQMVSLLAKLYLYPKQKIILIDEPELSLSLDWQRQILEDVINAPTCNQLVAITHSPFVFNNPLEPFARALNISINADLIPQTDDQDDDELGGELA